MKRGSLDFDLPEPNLVVHRIVHAALSDERNRRKALARAASPEDLAEAALPSSTAERRAMEVEREILDIYRCFYMIDRIGEQFEGTVSAFVGSGAFITLDEPFVDVLVRVEDLGGEFEIEDDGLMATSKRSGDAIRLGDRIMVEIADVAILRRTVYARRLRGERALDESPKTSPRSRRGGPPSRGKTDDRKKRDAGGGTDRNARPKKGLPARGGRGGKATPAKAGRKGGGKKKGRR
jgi:ribonuclease R